MYTHTHTHTKSTNPGLELLALNTHAQVYYFISRLIGDEHDLNYEDKRPNSTGERETETEKERKREALLGEWEAGISAPIGTINRLDDVIIIGSVILIFHQGPVPFKCTRDISLCS